jgi:hypothetical protein
MSSKRPSCRVCGCTEENACVTLNGPCQWAEEDLCTACVERAQANPVLTRLDLHALKQINFSVRLDGPVAFGILSALQLAMRHPHVPDRVGEMVVRFASVLQTQLSVTENLTLLCQAGWNPHLDVPSDVRDQPKIIVPTG